LGPKYFISKCSKEVRVTELREQLVLFETAGEPIPDLAAVADVVERVLRGPMDPTKRLFVEAAVASMTVDADRKVQLTLRIPSPGTTVNEGSSWVELTSLFTNQGLTAPTLDFTVSDRVRAGTTCRAEILAAFNRLDGDGPPKWHARDEVIAEVRRVNRHYPLGTIRRILVYDLVGRSTLHHVASDEFERNGDHFRRRSSGRR